MVIANGKCLRFSLGHNHFKKVGDEFEKTSTSWFVVDIWADNLDQYDWIKKGTKLIVEGKTKIEEYTDKEGNKRPSFRINSSSVFEAKNNKKQAVKKESQGKTFDDDIPF